MSKLAQAQALAAQAAATSENMTEAVKGGSGGRLLPAGRCLCRLVEVVELGKHPQEFQGKAKDPALEIQLGFALYGAGYENEDGTPYIIRPYSFPVSRNDKARAFLLLKSLNYKGTATCFAQLLGEAYLAEIVHEPKSKADPKIVSRLNLKGFLPPLDPLTAAPYPVPAPRDEDIRLFLWEHPTLEGWKELHIEGTWDDGKSKNMVQEKILSALDFAGSPLELLLSGAGLALPATPAALPAAPAAPAMPTPSAAVPAAPVAPAVAPAPVAAPLAPSAPVAAVPPIPAAPSVVASIAPIAPPIAPSSPALPQ
jgi:hypothetical protein